MRMRGKAGTSNNRYITKLRPFTRLSPKAGVCYRHHYRGAWHRAPGACSWCCARVTCCVSSRKISIFQYTVVDCKELKRRCASLTYAML
eukprot:3036139-Prymnesium_polylepis.1